MDRAHSGSTPVHKDTTSSAILKRSAIGPDIKICPYTILGTCQPSLKSLLVKINNHFRIHIWGFTNVVLQRRNVASRMFLVSIERLFNQWVNPFIDDIKSVVKLFGQRYVCIYFPVSNTLKYHQSKHFRKGYSWAICEGCIVGLRFHLSQNWWSHCRNPTPFVMFP